MQRTLFRALLLVLIATFGGGVVYLPDDGVYGVEVAHANRRFLARYEPDHPYSPPRFQLHPAPRSRHYYDDGRGLHLCFCHPNEWRPNYSLATAVGIVPVFLAAPSDVIRERVEQEHAPDVVARPKRGLSVLTARARYLLEPKLRRVRVQNPSLGRDRRQVLKRAADRAVNYRGLKPAASTS